MESPLELILFLSDIKYMNISDILDQYIKTAKGDIRELSEKLQDAWDKIQAIALAKKLLRSQGLPEVSRFSMEMELIAPWLVFVAVGPRLSTEILENKEIPEKYQKKIVSVFQAFNIIKANTKNRRGFDLVKWFDKFKPLVDLLLLAAKTWPDKTIGNQSLFELGPFRIHNTLGLSGNDLTGVKSSIEKILTLLPKTRVVGIQKVLYGDIYIVAKIRQERNLAWYFIKEDTIYLRPFINAGADELHNLMHEFGHRYLHRFATSEQKTAWMKYHIRLTYGQKDPSSIKFPQVGEEVWLAKPEGRGKAKQRPIVKAIDGVPGRGAKFYVDDVRKYYYPDNIFITAAKFPTTYASKDSDEHFCEALAFKALGRLTKEQEEVFDSIWL